MAEGYQLFWILRDRQPIPVEMEVWAKWFEKSFRTRSIVRTIISKRVYVSTVFLSHNHSFGGTKPLLFETMVFGGPMDQYQFRYATWMGAKYGHAKTVSKVRVFQKGFFWRKRMLNCGAFAVRLRGALQ